MSRRAPRRAGLRPTATATTTSTRDPQTPEEARQLLAAEVDEQTFLQDVIDYARARGWLVYHTYRSKKSAPGFPDGIAVRGDFLVAFETKVVGKSPTPAQWAWLDALNAIPCGHVVAFVWRPTDWALIVKVLT